MTNRFSRRDFLKLAGLSLTGLAYRPFQGSGDDLDPNRLIRVATHSISVYSRPDDAPSLRDGSILLDQLDARAGIARPDVRRPSVHARRARSR